MPTHILRQCQRRCLTFFVARNAIVFSPAVRAFACFTGKFFPRLQREGFCAPYRARTCRAAKRRSYDTHFFFRAKKETGVPKEKRQQGLRPCTPDATRALVCHGRIILTTPHYTKTQTERSVCVFERRRSGMSALLP